MAKAKARGRARLTPWRARLAQLRPTRAWLDPWVLTTGCLAGLGTLRAHVWLGALVSELNLQLALATLLCAAWAAFRKRAARAAFLCVFAVLWALPLWPYLRGTRPTPQHGPVFKVIQQDLASTHVEASGFSRWLVQEAPDVLSLTGLQADDRAALEDAAPGYRRLRSSHARDGLLLARSTWLPGAQSKHPMLRVGRCSLEVLQVELPSLFAARSLSRRRERISALAREPSGARRLYLGRLGSHSAAHDLSAWIARQGLRDVRMGHGILATAPAFLGGVGLPLDHVLLHGWILVRAAATGAPFAEGLHRPLSATLELTEARCAPPRS